MDGKECGIMFEESREIYGKLMDDESKSIYRNRMLFSLTDDISYILDMVLGTEYGRDFAEIFSKSTKRFMFGAGSWGRELAKVWGRYKGGWSGFIDNNSSLWGTEIEGLPVIRPQDIPSDASIFIASRWCYQEIIEQLIGLGISEDRIINVGRMLEQICDFAYFDLPKLPHHKDEIFVDVGAFDGMTSIKFIKWAKEYKKVICFEADSKNISNCKDTLQKVTDRFQIIDKAAWSTKTSICFDEKGTTNSRVDMTSSNTVQAVTIDETLEGEKITFIKMDIEGAEMEALEGARQIIKECKPKLGISVYHKIEDIFEISRLILDINQEYKFYLRHYSIGLVDTVLYAI